LFQLSDGEKSRHFLATRAAPCAVDQALSGRAHAVAHICIGGDSDDGLGDARGSTLPSMIQAAPRVADRFRDLSLVVGKHERHGWDPKTSEFETSRARRIAISALAMNATRSAGSQTTSAPTARPRSIKRRAGIGPADDQCRGDTAASSCGNNLEQPRGHVGGIRSAGGDDQPLWPASTDIIRGAAQLREFGPQQGIARAEQQLRAAGVCGA